MFTGRRDLEAVKSFPDVILERYILPFHGSYILSDICTMHIAGVCEPSHDMTDFNRFPDSSKIAWCNYMQKRALGWIRGNCMQRQRKCRFMRCRYKYDVDIFIGICETD